jgi:hypothetical protein
VLCWQLQTGYEEGGVLFSSVKFHVYDVEQC